MRVLPNNSAQAASNELKSEFMIVILMFHNLRERRLVVEVIVEEMEGLIKLWCMIIMKYKSNEYIYI